jgi:hypothetical protein
MSGFVYLWLDCKHKKYYVGSHWGTEDDGYICSSVWMLNAFKRRPNDFKRKIIARVTTNRSELFDREYYYLNLIEEHELGTKYYNITKHKNGHWTTDENKKLSVADKISKSRSGKKYGPRGEHSNETKQKISNTLKGRPLTPESIAKRSDTNTGKKHKKHKPHKRWTCDKLVCPHCSLEGSSPGMKRYHFDKCKEKVQ